MKSIDKLRELGKHTEPCIWTADDVKSAVMIEKETLDKCLDNIEREAADMRDFCERLDDAATKREDVTLWGVDYTPLPVDADGVPIHIEDVMEWPYGNGEFRVNGVGGSTLFYIDKDSGECEWTAAGDKRHHHAPTVEDVMVEFATDWESAQDGEDKTAVLREYAAKLQLKED